MEPDDDKTQSFVALTKGTMVSHYRSGQQSNAWNLLSPNSKCHKRFEETFIRRAVAALGRLALSERKSHEQSTIYHLYGCLLNHRDLCG